MKYLTILALAALSAAHADRASSFSQLTLAIRAMTLQ